MGLGRNVVAFRRRSGGFTLVEVLVALVVIAVGMLGIAVLYVEGMKAQRTSIYRNHAVNLVADLVERIRANVEAGGAYAGAGALIGCTNGFSDCTPTELAQEDLWSWQRDIGERLPPGAAGTVYFLPGGQTQRYTVGVTWPEAGLPAPQTYAVTVELGHGAGVASP